MPELKRKKPTTASRIIGGVWYTLVCVLFLAGGSLFGWAFSSPAMKAMVVTALGLKDSEPKTVFNADEMTVLVLGCDEDRYYGELQNTAARSDMMLLAKFDFANNRVGGISIPRDLEVDMAGYKVHKINAFHAIGGPELSRQAVEFMVGVKVDRVMVLNYEAFKDMVDIIGGVEVYVPKKMDYDDWGARLHIHLKPGRHKLNGEKAMGFVRFRKSDSDFARVERQRDLMLSFKKAVMNNPLALPKVVDKASEAFGGAFTPDEIAALSFFMRKIKSDQIKMGTLPVVDGRGTNLLIDHGRLTESLEDHYLLPRRTAMSSYGQ